MGYTNSRIIRLVFPDRDGLVVRMRPLSMGTLRWFIRNGPALARLDGQAPSQLSEADAALLEHLFEIFAEYLVSWNLEDEAEDGTRTPVPATLDGMDTQEPTFIQEIMGHWQQACVGVATPLGANSNGGDTSVERSLTMVPCSPSQAS